MLTFMIMVYEKHDIHKSRKMTMTVTHSLGNSVLKKLVLDFSYPLLFF